MENLLESSPRTAIRGDDSRRTDDSVQDIYNGSARLPVDTQARETTDHRMRLAIVANVRAGMWQLQPHTSSQARDGCQVPVESPPQSSLLRLAG